MSEQPDDNATSWPWHIEVLHIGGLNRFFYPDKESAEAVYEELEKVAAAARGFKNDVPADFTVADAVGRASIETHHIKTVRLVDFGTLDAEHRRRDLTHRREALAQGTPMALSESTPTGV